MFFKDGDRQTPTQLSFSVSDIQNQLSDDLISLFCVPALNGQRKQFLQKVRCMSYVIRGIAFAIDLIVLKMKKIIISLSKNSNPIESVSNTRT